VALVVDYLCRRSGQTPVGRGNPSDCKYFRGTIPVPLMTKLIGVKKKELEIFQNIVGNCLDEYFVGNKHRTNHNTVEKIQQCKRKRDDMVGSGADATSRGASIVLFPSTLIGELCIQLGSMVPDYEFVLSYAKSVFYFLINPRKLLSEQEMLTKRREFILLGRDIYANKSSFEAVCFYLAVKKCEGSNESLSKWSAQRKAHENFKATSGTGASDGQNLDHDDDEDIDADLTLKEYDVINAANILENNFKTIFDLVLRITQGVSIPLDFHTAQNLSALGSTELNGATKKHRERDKEGRPMHERAPSAEEQEKDMTAENMAFDHAYAKWERRVLQDATYNALKKFMDDNANFRDPDDETLLRLAADDVFQKFL